MGKYKWNTRQRLLRFLGSSRLWRRAGEKGVGVRCGVGKNGSTLSVFRPCHFLTFECEAHSQATLQAKQQKCSLCSRNETTQRKAASYLNLWTTSLIIFKNFPAFWPWLKVVLFATKNTCSLLQCQSWQCLFKMIFENFLNIWFINHDVSHWSTQLNMNRLCQHLHNLTLLASLKKLLGYCTAVLTSQLIYFLSLHMSLFWALCIDELEQCRVIYVGFNLPQYFYSSSM